MKLLYCLVLIALLAACGTPPVVGSYPTAAVPAAQRLRTVAPTTDHRPPTTDRPPTTSSRQPTATTPPQPTATLTFEPTTPPTSPPTVTPTVESTTIPTPTVVPPTFTPRPTAQPTQTPVPPTTTQPPLGPGGLPYPLQTSQLEYGIAAHLFYATDALPMQRAQEAGFGWIRQQIQWKDLEGPAGSYSWGELDNVVALTSRWNFKLLLSVVRAPSFYAGGAYGMPRNPDDLGRFVEVLATRYKGHVHAIEIWNEQNLAVENGGRVSIADAGHYVELLKAAYTSIKAVDPSIFVIAGPPSATGVTDEHIAVDDMDYYAAMYSYQNGIIRDYFDAQGVHPGGQANPPETLWPSQPSKAKGWTMHPTFYFRHVENVRALMKQYKLDNHQIWITEYGWATYNTTPGYEYGLQNSLDQQAAYIVGAMRWTKEHWAYVGVMSLWNLNFAILQTQSGQPTHEQASFAILNGNGSPRPAFTAIQQYLRGK